MLYSIIWVDLTYCKLSIDFVSYFFLRFAIDNITPNATPKNAANNTWKF